MWLSDFRIVPAAAAADVMGDLAKSDLLHGRDTADDISSSCILRSGVF